MIWTWPVRAAASSGRRNELSPAQSDDMMYVTCGRER